ncbi:hypothetical protein FRB99_008668 [Tulasnella sp. 403]|nr:hypothetical protein FRB99_008668 [Tulasnella sp. 403]
MKTPSIAPAFFPTALVRFHVGGLNAQNIKFITRIIEEYSPNLKDLAYEATLTMPPPESENWSILPRINGLSILRQRGIGLTDEIAAVLSIFPVLKTLSFGFDDTDDSDPWGIKEAQTPKDLRIFTGQQHFQQLVSYFSFPHLGPLALFTHHSAVPIAPILKHFIQGSGNYPFKSIVTRILSPLAMTPAFPKLRQLSHNSDSFGPVIALSSLPIIGGELPVSRIS